jgi:hypothetical protein
MKPNLFIVGAPKCGTTAWVEYLRSHPDVFFSTPKEPHFFSPDVQPTEVRFENIDEYLALFERTVAKVVGESSVRYLFSKVAAANIRAFNPEAKIIIFLRDQPNYLRSRHNELLYGGIEHIADFEKAWRLSREGPREAPRDRCPDPRLLDYVSWGRFHEQVQRFFFEFPQEQIRIFHFDDWSRGPRHTYLEILRFLGLDDDGRTEFPRVNVARYHKTRFVVDFVRSPPKSVAAAVNLVKRLTGRSGLGLGNLLFRLDTKKGSANRLSPQLRQEIEDYYRADNALVENRIWRPVASEAGSAAIETREFD